MIAAVRRLIVAAAWLWLAVVPASAQTGEVAGPYRGLFPPAPLTAAAAPAAKAASTELLVRAFGAVEHETIAAGDAAKPAGPYSAFSLELARTRRGTRLSADLRGFSQVRHQPSAGGFSADNQWVSLGAQAMLTPRTTLTVGQRLAYSTLYSPTQAAASAGTAGANANTNLTTTTAAALTRSVSRRTSAAFAYGFDHTRFSNTGTAATTNRAAATLTRALNRSVSLQAKAASIWSSSIGGTPATNAADLTVGIVAVPARTHALELTVGILPGVSRRNEPSAADPGAAPRVKGSFVMDGFVRISRQLTRDLRAEAGYQRQMFYLPGGNQLITANTGTAGISGTLAHAVTVSVSASYSRGTPDQRQAPQHVTSLSTSGRAEWRPAGRSSSLYVEVRRDAYTVTDGLTQLPGLARHANTASIRIGITQGLGAGLRRRGSR